MTNTTVTQHVTRLCAKKKDRAKSCGAVNGDMGQPGLLCRFEQDSCLVAGLVAGLVAEERPKELQN